MRRPVRLAVVASHPVQYHAPLYRELAAAPGLDLTVFFAHRPTPVEQGQGFGVAFEWDRDLTSGYAHVWLRNRAADPGAGTFGSYDTPDVGAELEAAKPDVVLVQGWHARTFWQAMTACWAARIPVLVRGDSQLATDAHWAKRAAKRVLYPAMLRRFAACLSVGTRSAAYFRYYGARRVIASPHFVDNAHFEAAAGNALPARAALRRRWGIDDDAMVFLFAGKLIEKKRPADLVRALALASLPGAVALYVGAGALQDAVAREAEQLGVSARFVGFLNQSEIPVAYAVADALVLPSDARETWGLVVNEAMAAGRPAVVSDAAGCAPDLVHDGRTGFQFPLADCAVLAARLRSLASDAAACARMGSAARALVNEKFSVGRAAEGVMQGVTLAVAG